MANEDKIRIMDEQMVAGDNGPKFMRTYAGPSDATKPKDNLANGSFYIKTDTNPVQVVHFDEVAQKWSDEE